MYDEDIFLYERSIGDGLLNLADTVRVRLERDVWLQFDHRNYMIKVSVTYLEGQR